MLEYIIEYAPAFIMVMLLFYQTYAYFLDISDALVPEKYPQLGWVIFLFPLIAWFFTYILLGLYFEGVIQYIFNDLNDSVSLIISNVIIFFISTYFLKKLKRKLYPEEEKGQIYDDDILDDPNF
ncbi:MAG: Kef-type K+ transport system membrane component KefB [Maribacter sp.]|jgi:Kef-type K+ transport system membrane component KefB